MAELTVKRIEAFHRALVQGGATKLTAPGQGLTTAAAIELTCALYQARKGTRNIGTDTDQYGMWGLIRASGWPWESKTQQLEDGNCRLRIVVGNQEDVGLLPFVQKMQRTLKASGGTSGFSRAVAGAFIEMAGNISEHSMTSKPAMMGYEIGYGRITCCFADLGVGVLESLRSNSKYQTLETSAQALDEALKEGGLTF